MGRRGIHACIHACNDQVIHACNDQVTVCYGPQAGLMAFADRQEELSRLYHFTCECVACKREAAAVVTQPRAAGSAAAHVATDPTMDLATHPQAGANADIAADFAADFAASSAADSAAEPATGSAPPTGGADAGAPSLVLTLPLIPKNYPFSLRTTPSS